MSKEVLFDDLYQDLVIKRSFDSDKDEQKNSADHEPVWHETGSQFFDNGE